MNSPQHMEKGETDNGIRTENKWNSVSIMISDKVIKPETLFTSMISAYFIES